MQSRQLLLKIDCDSMIFSETKKQVFEGWEGVGEGRKMGVGDETTEALAVA